MIGWRSFSSLGVYVESSTPPVNKLFFFIFIILFYFYFYFFYFYFYFLPCGLIGCSKMFLSRHFFIFRFIFIFNFCWIFFDRNNYIASSVLLASSVNYQFSTLFKKILFILFLFLFLFNYFYFILFYFILLFLPFLTKSIIIVEHLKYLKYLKKL